MSQSAQTNSIPLQMDHTFTLVNQTVIDNLTPSQLEDVFLATLANCGQLAKYRTVTQDVIMAKIVQYSIRMLHSEDWIPRTVIRAMVKCEVGSNRTLKGTMWEALRERRDEKIARSGAAAARRVRNGDSVAVNTGRTAAEPSKGRSMVEKTAGASRTTLLIQDSQEGEQVSV